MKTIVNGIFSFPEEGTFIRTNIKSESCQLTHSCDRLWTKSYTKSSLCMSEHLHSATTPNSCLKWNYLADYFHLAYFHFIMILYHKTQYSKSKQRDVPTNTHIHIFVRRKFKHFQGFSKHIFTFSSLHRATRDVVTLGGHTNGRLWLSCYFSAWITIQ